MHVERTFDQEFQSILRKIENAKDCADVSVAQKYSGTQVLPVTVVLAVTWLLHEAIKYSIFHILCSVHVTHHCAGCRFVAFFFYSFSVFIDNSVLKLLMRVTHNEGIVMFYSYCIYEIVIYLV